ncbi:hypothetical protein LZ31DRAFT_112517 [Colletotrichum somersetense]|nr:hypothetical protein LZ31DRAFT_112517 [Colletotrichum somersetense]
MCLERKRLQQDRVGCQRGCACWFGDRRTQDVRRRVSSVGRRGSEATGKASGRMETRGRASSALRNRGKRRIKQWKDIRWSRLRRVHGSVLAWGPRIEPR